MASDMIYGMGRIADSIVTAMKQYTNWKTLENEKQRKWQSEENQKQREFEAEQNEMYKVRPVKTQADPTRQS